MVIKNIKLIISIILFCCCTNILALCTYQKNNFTYLSKQCDVELFIEKMHIKYNFDREYLTQILDQANISYSTLKKFNQRYIKSNYNQKTILSEADLAKIYHERITDGLIYWQKHHKVLSYAAHKYHVPPEIIVAIIGMETLYGKAKLDYSAFDALVTLSFYNSVRKDYFTHELEQYLLLVRELKIAPDAIPSSYDGGIGIPQFMPSSYRIYAIAYQKNQKPNLMQNSNDAILSIANYLQQHGWQAKQKNLTVIATYNSNPNYIYLVYKTAQDLKSLHYAP